MRRGFCGVWARAGMALPSSSQVPDAQALEPSRHLLTSRE